MKLAYAFLILEYKLFCVKTRSANKTMIEILNCKLNYNNLNYCRYCDVKIKNTVILLQLRIADDILEIRMMQFTLLHQRRLLISTYGKADF